MGWANERGSTSYQRQARERAQETRGQKWPQNKRKKRQTYSYYEYRCILARYSLHVYKRVFAKIRDTWSLLRQNQLHTKNKYKTDRQKPSYWPALHRTWYLLLAWKGQVHGIFSTLPYVAFSWYCRILSQSERPYTSAPPRIIRRLIVDWYTATRRYHTRSLPILHV